MTTSIAMVMPEPGKPLERVERPVPEPKPTQAVVRVRATSINYHDRVNLLGMIAGGPWPRVPMSDGAGEVVAVGDDVATVAVGDRVITAFSPDWVGGPPTPLRQRTIVGDTCDGCLAQHVVLPATGLVPTPAHLDDAEAATMGCAGVTAWTSLQARPVRAGDVVVAQGTGGVSMYTVLLAKAAGATVILTSSSDAKLEVGRTWGADHLVNYRTNPEWHRAVKDLTGGRGADVIVDVGGPETLSRSVGAAALGGTVAVVGVLTGFGEASIPVSEVFRKNLHLAGVTVGSVADLAALARALEVGEIHPHSSHTFSWEEFERAVEVAQDNGHIGKVSVTID